MIFLKKKKEKKRSTKNSLFSVKKTADCLQINNKSADGLFLLFVVSIFEEL